MSLTKLAIATGVVAGVAVIAVTIWKRAGSSPAPPPARDSDDLGQFWAHEHRSEPQPVG